MKYLTGRTALITGSTHGIGREVAVTLAAAGARVAVHGRSAEAAAEVTAVLAQTDCHAGTFLADLADPALAGVSLKHAVVVIAYRGRSARVETCRWNAPPP